MAKRCGRSYWSRMVEECERREPGETRETFAARKKINVGTLRSWTYRLRRERASGRERVQFVEIEPPAETEANAQVDVELAGGRVRIRCAHVAADAIAEVVGQMVARLGC